MNGFHTPASPVIVFAFGLGFDFAASFSKRALSFLPSPLRPFLPCPCTRPSTSASSAAALSSPRSARPSRRRAARATRYRVLTRAGAGVRLGRLRAGEDSGGAASGTEHDGSERASDAALLVLPQFAYGIVVARRMPRAAVGDEEESEGRMGEEGEGGADGEGEAEEEEEEEERARARM